MFSGKSHYSIDEAANLLNCKLRDLIHLAVQEKITLLVGVPDNVRFRTYDATDDQIESPALLEPQLLALTQTHCLQMELNGKTEQSDFRKGYLINPAGQLQKLMPSYGRPKLNHLWAYWRTYDGPFSTKIELVPERLFVVGSDLLNLIKPNQKTEKSKKTIKEKAEPTFDIALASHQLSIDENKEIVESSGSQTKVTLTQASELKSFKSIPTATSVTQLTIIRLKTVQQRTGLSRSTIYDKMDAKSPRFDGTFPKRISLGTGSVGWYESEVNHWLESRRK